MEKISTWTINQFVRTTFKAVSYMVELDLTDGSKFQWEIARPEKVVEHFARSSPTFARVFAEAAQRAGAAPLTGVLYFDEITPGNVLAPQNQRKCWGVYLSFAELGRVALSRDQYWLAIATLRTSIAARTRGGFSACLRALLRAVLLSPCNLGTVGAPVMLPNGPLLLRMQLGHILGDEAALKTAMSAKGAAGLRPCYLCKNVTSLHGNLTSGQECEVTQKDKTIKPHTKTQQQNNQEYLVSVACTDARKFDLCRDRDLWEAWDMLASEKPRMPKAQFENLEKACGLVYNEFGLLSDTDLRALVPPASVTCMDWMHNFLQSGVLAQELTGFLGACKRKLQIGYREVQLFIESDWQGPVAQSTHSAASVFSPARERSAVDGVRASASESLLVFPYLRHFGLTVVGKSGLVDAEVRSLTKLCDALDIFLQIKRGQPLRGDLLHTLQEHLVLHQAAYQFDHTKPKHHFGLHNALRLQRTPVMLDTFVCERKHSVCGRQGGGMTRPQGIHRARRVASDAFGLLVMHGGLPVPGIRLQTRGFVKCGTPLSLSPDTWFQASRFVDVGPSLSPDTWFEARIEIVVFVLMWVALAPTPENQVVKNAASAVKNLRSYESSVLSRVLLEQARQVKVDIADGLVGPEEDSAIPPRVFSGQLIILWT